MFRTLKIQLMLINLALISVILLAVFIGLNLYMKSVVENRIAISMENMPQGVISEERLQYIEQAQSNSYFLVSLQNVSIAFGAISAAFALLISYLLAMRAIRPVRDSYEKQQVFVADASHELRTPLAILSTNLEAVLESPDELVSEQMQWLTNMQNEITRTTKLVEQLLFLARADAKTDTFLPELFSLSELAEKVITIFTPITSENGLTLNANIEQGIKLLGMESRISQLLIILLDNAVKHTPQGGEIAVKLYKAHSKIHVEVTDTGIGISGEQLPHIFTRFYRADTARARNSGGSGLGLSIAKQIINEHNSTIEVDSKIGIGTTFKIFFQI